jgi:hypothetical protein
MNRLYALASVGFCAASAALITSASALPSDEVPKTEPEYIAKVKTAAWVFEGCSNWIERLHVFCRRGWNARMRRPERHGMAQSSAGQAGPTE